MDVQSWNAVDETHAQFGLKHLLDHLNVAREDVSLWPYDIDERTGKRGKLVSEILRPAEASAAWQTLSSISTRKNHFAAGNINFMNANHARKRICCRHSWIIEEPDKTAAIITPIEIRAAAATLERWNIHIDDSPERAHRMFYGNFSTLLGHCRHRIWRLFRCLPFETSL